VADETARAQFELALRLTRGLAVSSTAGYAAPGVVEDFGRARDLCELLDDVPGVGTDLLKALFGLWSYYCVSGDFATVAAVTASIDHQLEKASMPAGRPSLDACRGVAAFFRGDLDDADRLLNGAVAGFVDDDVDPASWVLPNDPLAAALAFLGPLRFLRGDEAGAFDAVRAGLARCEGLEFPRGPFSVAFVRNYEAFLHRARGDADAAVAAAEDVIRVGERHGFLDWQIVGQMQLYAAQAMTAASPEAVGRLSEAITTWCTVGGEALVPYLLVEQAAGYLALDEVDPAAGALDHAFEIIGRGQRLAAAEALRLRAELTARTNPDGHDAIAADLVEAIRLGEEQSAVWFVLRAALSHARLLGGDSMDPGVRAALTRAVAAFDTASPLEDLVAARHVLTGSGSRVSSA
jgi:hypothetical protein